MFSVVCRAETVAESYQKFLLTFTDCNVIENSLTHSGLSPNDDMIDNSFSLFCVLNQGLVTCKDVMNENTVLFVLNKNSKESLEFSNRPEVEFVVNKKNKLVIYTKNSLDKDYHTFKFCKGIYSSMSEIKDFKINNVSKGLDVIIKSKK